jgi:hypothetical protein
MKSRSGSVLNGDKLYIGTANVKRQWVQNVQKTPQVSLAIGDENFKGTARFLTDRTEHERAMAAIRRKYWMFRPIIELGRLLATLGLMRDSTGSFEVTLADSARIGTPPQPAKSVKAWNRRTS